LISQPFLCQVVAQAVILANITDDMGAPFPVRITQDRFFNHDVTTLMRQDHTASSAKIEGKIGTPVMPYD
jgi:hypothetical protein